MQRCCFIAIILSLLVSCSTTGQVLSTDNVDDFVQDVDKAFMRKDVEAIRSSLADSVTVSVKVNGGAVKSYNKREYLALLESNWNRAESYSYNNIDNRTKLVGQGVAVVNQNVLENLVIDGKFYTVRSDIRVEVNLVRGSLVATRIDADTSLEVEKYTP